MSRLISAVLIGVSTLAAQHASVVRPGATMQPPVGAYRFGNILFPGGVAPHTQTHAGRLGGTISGAPPFAGRGGFQHRNRTIVVPYAVPMYYGDPYAYAYQQQQQSPNVTVVIPQQPAPSVVINHNYTPETAKPVLRDYSSSSLPEPGGLRVYEGPNKKAEAAQQETARKPVSDKPTIYLIALKDSTIRQAIGYWVEDGTLHYVTPQSTINHVTLDNVDRELSQQLNSERNLEFDLSVRR